MPRKTDPEDIYERIQLDYDIEELTQKIIEDWLVKGVKKTTGEDIGTTIAIRTISEEVEGLAIKELKPLINVAETKDDFENLEKVEQKDAKELIKERRIEVELDLVERVKKEVREKPFREAVDSLRELNPRRFGGIRSGETRRAKSAFRVMFG